MRIILGHVSYIRVKSGNFGHQVNSDLRFQTMEIQIRRLIYVFIPVIKI